MKTLSFPFLETKEKDTCSKLRWQRSLDSKFALAPNQPSRVAAISSRTSANALFLFTRSELSNGVQLADLFAYNVYRAYRDENTNYPYSDPFSPKHTGDASSLAGLKVWPETSPLISFADRAANQKNQ